MARNKKQESASPAGFVPASTQRGRHSIELGPATSNVIAPPDSPASQGSYAQYSRNTADYAHRKKRGMSRGAKIAIALIIVALIAGVSALGFYIYKESQKQAINNDLHNISQQEMEAIDNELTGMISIDQPFTMLLLGSDARSDDPDMGARTDTIILVRVDPKKNAISMVSIPRDTRVQLSDGSMQKINAAYTYGGPSGTIAAVKNLCGVDIDHYAEINFEGLVGLVDSIGGIDVYVEEPVIDRDAGDINIEETGLVHLNGEGALVFSRSRQYADGDFTRVSNQRKVIEAIVKKGLEAPATELYGLVSASTAFLTTDSAMDVDFIYSLADQIRHNNDYPVTLTTATIPASTATIDGVSYVIADEAGLDALMQKFVSGGDISGTGAVVIEENANPTSSSTSATSSKSTSSSSSSSTP